VRICACRSYDRQKEEKRTVLRLQSHLNVLTRAVSVKRLREAALGRVKRISKLSLNRAAADRGMSVSYAVSEEDERMMAMYRAQLRAVVAELLLVHCAAPTATAASATLPASSVSSSAAADSASIDGSSNSSSHWSIAYTALDLDAPADAAADDDAGSHMPHRTGTAAGDVVHRGPSDQSHGVQLDSITAMSVGAAADSTGGSAGGSFDRSLRSAHQSAPVSVSGITRPAYAGAVSAVYTSPLVMLRGYRLSPHFSSWLNSSAASASRMDTNEPQRAVAALRTAAGGVGALNVDCMQFMCRFDLTGVCNDAKCSFVHFRGNVLLLHSLKKP